LKNRAKKASKTKKPAEGKHRWLFVVLIDKLRR